MKKYFVIFSFFSVLNIFAQEPEKPEQTTTTTTVVKTTILPVEEIKSKLIKKNEIRLDPFFLIFFGGVNATYEHILNEESSVGVSLLASNGKEYNRTFSLTPYYRLYFGKKVASGFFVEGFAMYNVTNTQILQITPNNNNGFYYDEINYKKEKINDLALGLAIGGKWVSRRGIIFEISGGLGRNLLYDYDKYTRDDFNKVVGRGGITIGKRF